MQGPEGCRSPPVSPPKDLPSVSDILAAANMRRLLEAYRNLAPLTIGGPSSTSLEAPGSGGPRPHTFPDPRLVRKFAHYPWLLGGPAPGLPPALLAKSEEQASRRRHVSCDSLQAARQARLSPSGPVFSIKDRESSR